MPNFGLDAVGELVRASPKALLTLALIVQTMLITWLAGELLERSTVERQSSRELSDRLLECYRSKSATSAAIAPRASRFKAISGESLSGMGDNINDSLVSGSKKTAESK